MHRNHDYIRAKISIIADTLKKILDVSAKDAHDSNGMEQGCKLLIIEDEIESIKWALRDRDTFDKLGRLRNRS